MTTQPRIIPTTCKECSTFSGPFWNGFCPTCIDDFCANGSGEDCGLPAVPEDQMDDTVLHMAKHEREHADLFPGANCMLCQLANEVCDECDLESRDMEQEDEEAHLIVGNIILIGCEGYHEPVFRYAYWAEVA